MPESGQAGDGAGPAPPVIVLVAPQLARNIGATARAMANFGLAELRLVAPRDGWPNPEARATASGATGILERATVHADLADAVADRQIVLATTARRREQPRPELDPAAAAARLREAAPGRSAVVFGGERAGLANADVELAAAIIRIPTDPAFSSLNLGQSVLLVAYEWWRAGVVRTPDPFAAERAGRGAVEVLARHLEAELDSVGYFHPPERRPSTLGQLRSLLHRQLLTDGEVRMLHGVIRALRRAGR